MKACIIFNPSAKGEKSRRYLQELHNLGSQCVLMPTTCAGDARRLAAAAVCDGFETIVAAGGDGTLNEVLNGMADQPASLKRVSLGVIPLGTVNVFAKELKIPKSVSGAWEIIRDGRNVSVDLPVVSFCGSDDHPQARAFVQLAGAGWDARAVELVNWELKKKSGQMAYVVAGLQALAGEKPMITVSDGIRTERGELVLIGNGQFYGGAFSVFHHADYADGYLDVCVFPKVNWLSLPTYAWEMVTGNLFQQTSAIYFKARALKITSESKTAFQLEGELVGHLPAEITLMRESLRVIVPRR
ncbi:MAG: diacylglycerol/lipid kinase family protein [Verrucomicrobiales bacterium]